MAESSVPRIAILASGSGSTAESVIHATQTGVLNAEVGLVISNKSKADVLQRVLRMNRQYDLDIAAMHISSETHPGGPTGIGKQTNEESAAICKILDAGGFSLVALLGYMKQVRGPLLDEYGWHGGEPTTGRMVNTHPGPLPRTAGRDGLQVQTYVLSTGLSHSAQILHLVTEGYDAGPVLNEHRVPVLEGDSPASLFESVQLTEKAYLPRDIDAFLQAQAAAAEAAA